MGRANIDLSWLASLLTKTPTATENPTYGATDEQPYTDPVTGQTSSVKAYLDAQGNEIPGTVVGKDTTNKFVTPSAWQRMIHPEESAQVTALNNKFATAKPFAQLQNQLETDTALSNYNETPDWAKPANTTPTQAVAMGYGMRQQPTVLQRENTSALNLQGGLPYTASRNDITKEQLDLSQNQGALNREPMSEQVLDEQTANNLARLTGEDRLQIELNAKTLAGQLKRFPTAEQVREYTLNNQLNDQKNVVPMQQDEALQNATVGRNIARTRVGLQPYTDRILKNQAVKDVVESSQIPVGAPVVNTIGADGKVTRLAKNSYGMSPMQQKMQEALDIGNVVNGNGDVSVITLPSGQKIGIKNKQPDQTIDPMNPDSSGVVRKPAATVNTEDRTINNTEEQAPVVPVRQAVSALPKTGIKEIDDAAQQQINSESAQSQKYQQQLKEQNATEWGKDQAQKVATSEYDIKHQIEGLKYQIQEQLRLAHDPQPQVSTSPEIRARTIQYLQKQIEDLAQQLGSSYE